MATDRLTLTRALENGGMETQAAEKVATAIYDAIRDNVATKTDVNAGFALLRGEMREMEQRIVIRLGGMIVIGVGVLIAIKYFG